MFGLYVGLARDPIFNTGVANKADNRASDFQRIGRLQSTIDY
jgi:hypothetical protein